MKKLLVLLMFSMVLAPMAKADQIQGFMDGKFYDTNATLKYYCFMDGNCYDLQMKLAPIKFTPTTFAQPTQVFVPYDACPNIEGIQSTEPEGMGKINGSCIFPVNSTFTCTQQITDANTKLVDLKQKFDLFKATYNPQASTNGLAEATATYNSEVFKQNQIIKQSETKLTCND